jgi:hypothetical protein
MSWPIAEQSRRHAAVPQSKRRTPRIMWAVVLAAFICGAAVSAAAFSIGWKHQAQKNTTAESALVAATARTHALRTQLATERSALAAAHALNAHSATARRALNAALAKLLGKTTAAEQKLANVNVAAGRLSGDLDRLTNELHSLTAYVSTTPAAQLDAGYVQTQLAYLAKTVAGFSSAVAALAPH